MRRVRTAGGYGSNTCLMCDVPDVSLCVMSVVVRSLLRAELFAHFKSPWEAKGKELCNKLYFLQRHTATISHDTY